MVAVRLSFSGASLVRRARRRVWYFKSSLVVSSGAFRYFSNRAWKNLWLLTFQFLPSQERISLPGLNDGTSLPRNELPCGALLGAEEEEDAGAAGCGCGLEGTGASGTWARTVAALQRTSERRSRFMPF